MQCHKILVTNVTIHTPYLCAILWNIRRGQQHNLFQRAVLKDLIVPEIQTESTALIVLDKETPCLLSSYNRAFLLERLY